MTSVYPVIQAASPEARKTAAGGMSRGDSAGGSNVMSLALSNCSMLAYSWDAPDPVLVAFRRAEPPIAARIRQERFSISNGVGGGSVAPDQEEV